MVQLNTNYDKDLKQRIFVLKGEETYARTTDVLASLVSDYNDCGTRLMYARVGIEIEVLRNFGDGFIYIYDNNQQIHTYDLPWFDSVSEMQQYYNTEEWANKGVTYYDGKLLIGSDSILTSGFNLAYDMEHNIKVKYSGTKYCLGSTSEILTFNMPTPELFNGTLTFTSGSDNRYDTGATIDDLVVTYVSNGSATNDKIIKIYEGNTLLADDITVPNNTPTTVSLDSSLSEGVHTLRAVFLGDDRSTYTETSLDISVGYKVTITSQPQAILNGNQCSITCNVVDYLNNPVVNGAVKCRSSPSSIVSSTFYTGSNGNATLTDCVLTTSNCYIDYTSTGSVTYSSSKITTNVVTITGITMDTSDAYIGNMESMNITGSVTSNVSAEGLAVQYNYNGFTNSVRVNSNNAFIVTIQGDSELGDKQLTVSCAGISKTKPIHNVYAYWNRGIKEINLNYSMLYGQFHMSSKYYVITPNVGQTAQLRLTPPEYTQYQNISYELSFDVNNINESTLGFGKLGLDGTYYEEEKSIAVLPYYANVKIKVSGEVLVWVNGEIVYSSINMMDNTPVILVSGDNPYRSLGISNLVWKRIWDE